MSFPTRRKARRSGFRPRQAGTAQDPRNGDPVGPDRAHSTAPRGTLAGDPAAVRLDAGDARDDRPRRPHVLRPVTRPGRGCRPPRTSRDPAPGRAPRREHHRATRRDARRAARCRCGRRRRRPARRLLGAGRRRRSLRRGDHRRSAARRRAADPRRCAQRVGRAAVPEAQPWRCRTSPDGREPRPRPAERRGRVEADRENSVPRWVQAWKSGHPVAVRRVNGRPGNPIGRSKRLERCIDVPPHRLPAVHRPSRRSRTRCSR